MYRSISLYFEALTDTIQTDWWWWNISRCHSWLVSGATTKLVHGYSFSL